MSEFNIGGAFPGWETDGVLGSGIFGTVYLAHTLVDAKPVYAAVKVIKTPPTPEAIDNAEKMGISRDLLKTYFGKFKNELNWELTMFKTVSSQHLVNVDAIAMEDLPNAGWVGYIRSAVYTPLSVYFETATATQEDAARLGAEISSALEALGEYGMIHGEIKPENVLVSDTGSFLLADYGIRRCLEKAGAGLFGLTASEYEAPEIGEERNYTQAADIYALGMLMCYTANGCALPEGNNPDNIPDIDEKLAAIIKRATANNPEERYQTPSEMHADICRLSLFTKRRPQRRAVAAAAAFELVKKNGSTIRNVTPEPSVMNSEDAFEKAVKDSRNNAVFSEETFNKAFADKKTAYTYPDVNKDRKKISKKTAGVIAVAIIIVLALAIGFFVHSRNTDDVQSDAPDEIVNGLPTGEDIENDIPDNQEDEQLTDTDPGQDDMIPDDADDNDGETSDNDDNGEVSDTQNENSDSTEQTQDNTADNNTGNQSGSTAPNTSGNQSTNNNNANTNTNTSNNNNTAKTSIYVIENSDTVLITREDLEGMDRETSYTAINEIYARHGKIFTDKTINAYFESQSWYTPVTTESDSVVAQFNSVEKANIITLTEYQKEMGYRSSGSAGTTTVPEPDTSTDPEPVTEPSTEVETDPVTEPDTDPVTEPEKEPDTDAVTEPVKDSESETENNAEETPGEDISVSDESDYFLPTNTERITRADLEGMDREQSYLAINEIYARYGKIFTDKTIQSYFEAQSWYTPVTTDSAEITVQFTELEYANLHTLTAYQREMGYRS